MKWIDRLEVKFGRFAIHGLVRILIAFNALVFFLYKINPTFLRVISLEPREILHGQVWRLVTYIFIPQFGTLLPDYFSVVLYLWFLWFIGEGLERAMGAFRLNLYFLIGMIGTTIAAFFFGSNFSNVMLSTSLFYAFARYFPDMLIYIFFVLPVKIKWMAWVAAFFLLLSFVQGLMAGDYGYCMAVVAALANYLIFFGPEIIHDARHRHSVATRRQRFEEATAPESSAMHCCVVCKRTEVSHPYLDFRVGKDGNDYCVEHLSKGAG